MGGVCCAGAGVNCFPDLDGDGFGDKWSTGKLSCSCQVGTAPNNQDCQDADPAVNPNATFHIASDNPSMYTPDLRDPAPDGWDWNCNGVEDMSSLPPFNVASGCVVGGQAGCPDCVQATILASFTIPCGGFLGQDFCASMGCGVNGAPGCGGVGVPTTPQGCK